MLTSYQASVELERQSEAVATMGLRQKRDALPNTLRVSAARRSFVVKRVFSYAAWSFFCASF